MNRDIPCITIKVEYNGEQVSQEGTLFIDAISFLCQVEAAIRRNSKLERDAVDSRTSVLQKENMDKLLTDLRNAKSVGEEHEQTTD